ncbi:MAG: hypothetical protein ABSC42_14845 [Tepidisphaeraceae bacterium]|jgi:NADH:ubiquinone oxidoreductase subunit K
MSIPESGGVPLLPYESKDRKEPPGPRPWWVYGLIAVYLLILAGVLILPAFIQYSDQNTDDQFIWVLTIYVCGLVVCGLALMVLPIKAIRQRPISRRSIWFPIIASGLLAGALLFGGGFALIAVFRGDDVPSPLGWAILFSSVGVWAAWSIVFALIAVRSGPGRIGMTLHRLLITGSVLELLVAVPSHVIVRRRHLCCADIATGFGICIGLSVMIVSLGPSVLILFHRRRKRITPPAAIERN